MKTTSPQTPWAREVEKICAAVRIESPTAFTIAGESFVAAPQETAADVGARLLMTLYERCYTRPVDSRSTVDERATAGLDADPTFGRCLRDAHDDPPRWEPGWTVVAVEASGRVLAIRQHETRHLSPGSYVSSAGWYAPVWPGTAITVWSARGSFDTQPGFYVVEGATAEPAHDPGRVLRVYWNIRAAGAPRLLSMLTRELDRRQVPFRFKTLARAEHYADRTDGSVLYIAQRDFPRVAQVCADQLPLLSADLGEAVPLFSKRLAPGLAIAEDPGNGDSFGLSRCRILASALLDAQAAGITASTAQLAHVAEWFARHRLSLDHPYLNPGSVDCYALPTTAVEGPEAHDEEAPHAVSDHSSASPR